MITKINEFKNKKINENNVHDLFDHEVLSIWNKLAEPQGYEIVKLNSEESFNNDMKGIEPYALLRKLKNVHYDISDKYYYIDTNGDPVSSNKLSDLIDYNIVQEYIDENGIDL